MAASSPRSSTPTPPPCWSSIVQQKPTPKPQQPISSTVFGDCKSSNSKGISVAVVDANAIIHGDKLVGVSDKFVTIAQVLDEVRDPVSRQRLNFLPLEVEVMEPDADSIRKVVKFARETGDLQTLSDVDLKLIALSYMLESQIHGTSQLRDSPPPLLVKNVRNLPEAQMPGWGSNVPNLAEWEALEQLPEWNLDKESQVLPLKDLIDNQEEKEKTFGITRRFAFPPKKEVKLDGKKMVADGIDASLGEDAENADDWQPAVSRSTHRRFLKRQARRELSKALEKDGLSCEENDEDDDLVKEDLEEDHISASLELIKLSPDHSEAGEEVDEQDSDDKYLCREDDEKDMSAEELDNLEVSSQTEESIDASIADGGSSEQSWMLRSLSDSTVACITSDFAMQNVILQIGLRLLAPGGMQIRQLQRWVLKCHACFKVTHEIGRIFCPKCGNGGTLRKVSVKVDSNGVSLEARRQRTFLRGTKFSLPLPQGGRDAITKNPILREDQLPRKLLYPKTKKSNKQDQDFLGSDAIFSHSGEKRAPLKPPVRKALAMFSGKRNPNDNHFSRSKR